MLSTINDSKQGWMRGLFFPTLICSALLHAGILWVPLPSEKKAAKPPEPTPEKTVPINQFVSLKAPPKKPLSSPKSLPKSKAIALRPKSATPKQVIHLKPKPTQQQLPKVAAKQPLPQPTPKAVEKPAPPPPPAEDTGDHSQEFQEAFNSYSSGNPDVKKGSDVPWFNMPEQEKFFTSASIAQMQNDPSAAPELLPNLADTFYQSNIAPADAVDKLKALYAGFKFTEKAAFANGQLYEIRKGGTVQYLNFLKSTKGLGTFVAVWKNDPNQK